MEDVLTEMKCPRCGYKLDTDHCARDNADAYGANVYACPNCGKPFTFYRVVVCQALPSMFYHDVDNWGRKIVNDEEYKKTK